MPRNVGVSIENAFNRGLITEVTGVNSPENSVTETMNVTYDRRGRAVKRGAFVFEDEYQLNSVGTAAVHTEYIWRTISSNVGQDFVVIQVGARLHFFSVQSNKSLSSSKKSFTVNLATYKTPNFTSTQVAGTPATYSTGRGYLFVAHPFCDTIYIKYDSKTDSVTTSRIVLKIRDLEGIEDNRPVDQRPTSLTNTHKYNLFNQGWYATVTNGDNISKNALVYWDENRTDFPSNVDVWWYYTGVAPSASQIEFFDHKTIPSRTGLYGNTPAPRGHYIVTALQTERRTLSGIPSIQESSSDGLRPSCVAFYAGRVFYAGVGKSGFSSLIYFSQIIERDDQLGKCYQANDPTSREIFDLLDTDGGIVDIQNINTIYDMMVVGQSLIVFASNGVWSISGSDNGPFRATDYSVTRITTEASVSRSSIIDVSGSPIWWNHEGIFSLKTSETGLTTDVTSLTVASIQEFYDDIPQQSKADAKGAFNNQTNLIYWLYSSDSLNTKDYDRILVLDAVSLAFYVYSLPSPTPSIKGLVALRSSGAQYGDSNVVVEDDDPVVTTTGDQVIIQEYLGLFSTNTVFKFVTVADGDLTFSEIDQDQMLDWGVKDYETYFISGYRIRGEVLRSSQTNYLTVIMDTIPDSSCMVQGIWDYANHPDTGRFTNPQQGYSSWPNYDYQMTRLKMRGTGKTLQFKFTGQSGRPMSVIGWAGYETANTSP